MFNPFKALSNTVSFFGHSLWVIAATEVSTFREWLQKRGEENDDPGLGQDGQ